MSRELARRIEAVEARSPHLRHSIDLSGCTNEELELLASCPVADEGDPNAWFANLTPAERYAVEAIAERLKAPLRLRLTS